MQISSNVSEKKGWLKIGQRFKSFFQAIPKNKIEGEEIDYYHQYVFPRKIERIKNKSTLLRRTSKREY